MTAGSVVCIPPGLRYTTAMSEIETTRQNAFLRAGAISAWLIVLIYAAELLVVAIFGLPPVFGSAQEWLSALQRNRLVGILQTFSLDIVAVAFHAPLYLALIFLLRRFRRGYPTLILAAVFAFIGMAVYFASNPTFSMLYLSDQLVAATTDAQKARVLDSAQTMVALWNGTGPIVATNLSGIAGILASVVMLQSGTFSRIVSIAGIVGNALELGPPPTLLPPLYLKVDPLAVALGGIILLFWYVAIGLKLWKEPAVAA